MRRVARTGAMVTLLVLAGCGGTATPGQTTGSSPAPASPVQSQVPSPTLEPSHGTAVIPSDAPLPTAGPSKSPRPMSPATLTKGPALSLARQSHAAVRLADGRVLVIGGLVPFTGKCEMACVAPPTTSVEIYDPARGTFRPGGSLAESLENIDALPLNDGRVLVYGWSDVGLMELFDPATGKATAVKLPAEVPQLPTGATIALLRDGRVLIVGGMWSGRSSYGTLIFDPVSGGFTEGPAIFESRIGAIATVLADGRVLILGGKPYQGDTSEAERDTAELIDPAHPLDRSVILNPLGHPRIRGVATSTLLSDGRVLIVGSGRYDSFSGCTAPENSEIFDPTTGTFAFGAAMNVPRSGLTAVRIKDGRVVFFGGQDASCAAAQTVEAFDPDSGTFSVIATGFPRIADFSATPLDDGQILIAGGNDRISTAYLSATWLLKP